MQTSLPEDYLATPEGQRAEQILRSCVHCGFCNATCPTYRLLGNELDGPRGRIYLMKDMLEQQSVSEVSVTHLDRCLTCRACETTCPSGVAYGELLEIGRNFQAENHRRGWLDRLVRRWLLRVLPDADSLRRWSALGRMAKPFLSRRLSRQLPPRAGHSAARPVQTQEDPARGKVLLLDGCVQRVSTPAVNDALEALLVSMRIDVIRLPDEGCCGGLALHLGKETEALATMTSSLDLIATVLDDVDAVVSTASGCGVTLKEYARLLAVDSDRSQLAERFSDKVMDVGQYLWSLEWQPSGNPSGRRVALHIPCTLAHGQRQGEYPGLLLERAGYQLVPVADAHLCCGSAGTYSILEPGLSEQLGEARAAALTAGNPELIATANVGCQVHLAGFSGVPVMHWVELLQDAAGRSE